MLSRRLPFYFSLVLLLLIQAQGFALGLDDFQARTYKDAAGKTLNYRLFTPKNYKSGEKYPLILFLHGSGERGSDNQKQVGYFAASVFADDFTQAAHPCFLVAPQCPENDSWAAIRGTRQDGTLSDAPTEPLRLTLEMLAGLQKEFSLDANRLYITGLSMGGYGTWDALARRPGLFAAAVPICGGGDPATAKRFAGTPVWDFHGGADPVVSPARSHHMIIALREAGGAPQFTEYPGVGHNSWEKAYREPTLTEWLFRQHLPLPQILQKGFRAKPTLAGRKSFSDAGLIAVWRANETNDKAVPDLSKNHNDLPLQNGQLGLQENSVLNFSDTQPILTFQPKPDSGLDKAFTLAAWILVEPGYYDPETLFEIDSMDGATHIPIGLDNAHRLCWDFSRLKPAFTEDLMTPVHSVAPFLPTGWRHIAATYAGDTVQIYMDGKISSQVVGSSAARARRRFPYAAYRRRTAGQKSVLRQNERHSPVQSRPFREGDCRAGGRKTLTRGNARNRV